MTENISNKGPIFIDVREDADQDEIPKIASETVSESSKAKNSVTGAKSLDPSLLVQTRRVRCMICKRYSAENEEKMLRHVRKVHRGENPFQCYMCDYSTYNKSLFEDHVRMHQGIKPFKCSHCPYRSVSKRNTKKHELIHRPDNPLGCSQCPFIARNSKSLNSHRQKTHSDDATEQDLKCAKCDATFSDHEVYNEHLKSRKRCTRCDITLCKPLLKKHKKEVHGMFVKKKSTKPKEYHLKCKVCKWSTSSKPRFLLHLIHHPNQDLSDCYVDLTILKKHGILPAVIDA